jgi:hypothetical protein
MEKRWRLLRQRRKRRKEKKTLKNVARYTPGLLLWKSRGDEVVGSNALIHSAAFCAWRVHEKRCHCCAESLFVCAGNI